MNSVASIDGFGPGRSRKDFEPRSRFGPAGIAVMVGLHVLIGYALVSGLARTAVELVKKPLDAALIQEVKLPPPPPPPPPPKPQIRHEAPPPSAPPPPSYVPPPEVAPPESSAPAAIAAVQDAQPVAPPPAAAPAQPAPAGPLRQDIAVVCPKQVRPVMPPKAEEEGISGKVRAEARIKGGVVVDVRVLSGPKVYHAAVRSAMLQYQCVGRSDEEIVATQEFEFKVE